MILGPPTHHRLCVRIRAWDSPNVKLALWEIEQGRQPSGTVVVPGVLSWAALQSKLARFSKQRITESIEADWYAGPEERLVTDDWIKFAVEHAKTLPARRSGRKWMGVDPGEGGDDSAWCVGDKQGVLDLVSMPTPDTNQVFGRTVMMARQWGIAWPDVIFDLGGGGKQHVDRLRSAGMPVRGLRFGAIKREVKRSMTFFEERREVEEDTAAYKSRRSEMAWGVRMLLERRLPLDAQVKLDNVGDEMQRVLAGLVSREREKVKDNPPYGLPCPLCDELIRQIRAVPLTFDAEGKFLLIPKAPPANRPDDPNCFRARIGRSPDQFDAFMMTVWGMNNEPTRIEAGSA